MTETRESSFNYEISVCIYSQHNPPVHSRLLGRERGTDTLNTYHKHIHNCEIQVGPSVDNLNINRFVVISMLFGSVQNYSHTRAQENSHMCENRLLLLFVFSERF